MMGIENNVISTDPADQVASFLGHFWSDLQLIWAQNSIPTWFILAGSTIGGFILGRLIASILLRIAHLYENRHHPNRAQVLRALAGPVNLGLMTLGLSIGFGALSFNDNLFLGQELKTCAFGSLKLLFYTAFFWFAYNFIGIFGLVVKRFGRKTKSALDRQVVPLVERSLRVCLLAFACLVICNRVFGLENIGTWLAGFGIVGLAVSLAAQDTLKNLFGSLTLLFDRPFQIDDRVVLCGTEGTIEDIGFRSTKVRTSQGHLVSIPNSNVVNASIENISRRPAVRRVVNLQINPNTPIQKVQEAIVGILAIFEEEPLRGHVYPSSHGVAKPPQARFEDILASGFQISITYWYAPANDPKYKPHQEMVNIRVVEVLQNLGIAFSSS